MLVLSRDVGESLFIIAPDGTRIEVMITDTQRGRAKVGIDAPIEWKVLRKELLDLIDEARRDRK